MYKCVFMNQVFSRASALSIQDSSVIRFPKKENSLFCIMGDMVARMTWRGTAVRGYTLRHFTLCCHNHCIYATRPFAADKRHT